MKIRNYTSSVPVERSISEIESLLVEAGATHVARSYEKQKITGFIFQLWVGDRPVTFKLPSNPDAVSKVLSGDVKRPRQGTMKKIEAQADRTAWRLLHEWVHIQITMIIMKQAEAIQVFLPYAYDAKNDQTYFEKIKSSGFKLLEAKGANS